MKGPSISSILGLKKPAGWGKGKWKAKDRGGWIKPDKRRNKVKRKALKVWAEQQRKSNG